MYPRITDIALSWILSRTAIRRVLLSALAMAIVLFSLQGCSTESARLQKQDFHQMKLRRASDDALRAGELAKSAKSQVHREQQIAIEQLSEIELQLEQARAARSESRAKIQQHRLLPR